MKGYACTEAGSFHRGFTERESPVLLQTWLRNLFHGPLLDRRSHTPPACSQAQTQLLDLHRECWGKKSQCYLPQVADWLSWHRSQTVYEDKASGETGFCPPENHFPAVSRKELASIVFPTPSLLRSENQKCLNDRSPKTWQVSPRVRNNQSGPVVP